MNAFVAFIFSIFSTPVFAGVITILPVREQAIHCAVQLARADGSLEMLPRAGNDGKIVLKGGSASGWRGEKQFAFETPAGTAAYRADLDVLLEENASNWFENTKRLTVSGSLTDLTANRLLAIQDNHSDQLWTPFMLNNLMDGNAPRVISRIRNPEFPERLRKGVEVPLKLADRLDIVCWGE